MADPAKKARLEAYYADYADHPMLSDQARAEMWELERGLFNLLERDDADALYLSPEEVNPWLPILLELLSPVEAQAQQAAERGEPVVQKPARFNVSTDCLCAVRSAPQMVCAA